MTTGRPQAAVARAATDLAVPGEPEVMAARLAQAFDELVGEPGTAVWRLDPDLGRLVRLGAGGEGRPAMVELAALPDDVVRRLPLSGSTASQPTLIQSAEVAPLAQANGRILLAGLPGEGRAVGLVAVPAEHAAELDDEVREAAVVLAALGGAALERHGLLDVRGHQVRQLEILYALTEALVARGDADALCARLNELLAPEGYEVTGLAFRQRDLARHLGGAGPTPAEQEAWEADGWSRGGDGTVGVPLRLGDRVVGTLRVRLPDPPPPAWRAFLEALGAGVAQLSARSALRAALEQARRERALSQERERIAGEVHETVAAALGAIDARLRRIAEELPADLPAREQVAATARLADGASWHLEQAVRALAFVPTAHRGLDAALRGLAGQVETDSGIAVLVDVEGRPARLPGRVERALYRVASEALAAAWRYARCSVIRIEVAYARDEVVLRVRDDGLGLAKRQERGAPATTLHAIRGAVTDVGGRMEFRAVTPHGMELEVAVPRGRRAG